MVLGVLSVFGQQLDYVSSALKVLDNSSNNQYGIRGQPRFDKVCTLQVPKHYTFPSFGEGNVALQAAPNPYYLCTIYLNKIH